MKDGHEARKIVFSKSAIQEADVTHPAVHKFIQIDKSVHKGWGSLQHVLQLEIRGLVKEIK